MKKIQVSLGSYLLAASPDVLISYGLGSCVAVALFNPSIKLAAMAHVMLPGRGPEDANGDPAKYSDQAIECMLEELMRRGKGRGKLVAKIAGGAQMFPPPSSFPEGSPGQRNVEAIVRKLAQERIPLVGMDVGKNFGRNVEFYPESGKMLIRTIAVGVTEI